MRRLLIVLTIGLIGTAALRAVADQRDRPARAQTMRMTATAYCDRGTTRSGVRTRTGIVAADPRLLPVGSVLRIVDGATTGIYTVMDTGAAVKGRRIDIFVPNCGEAKAFGVRRVVLRVLRLGWDPKASASEADDGR
jgi:3D (Asp-Asp-Asp) domain-containing protein